MRLPARSIAFEKREADLSAAYQIAEKIPSALLLHEELAFLDKAR